MHPLYDVMLKDLANDQRQMLEEGHGQQHLQAELDAARASGSFDALLALQQDWWNRSSPASFPYVEPSDWDGIRATFPTADSHARFAGREQDLADRLLAAWQGRCVGCQLGKPLEGLTWPDKIRSVLQGVGSWPLVDYMNPVPESMRVEQVPGCDFFQKNDAWRNTLCRGRFDHVAPDDDIHYAILGELLLEDHGPGFTTQQMVANLLNRSPVWTLFAAGRNLFRTTLWGVPLPHTATLGNPCRQSLGAMIRCDPFGWGAPANPSLAAEMAYKDAVSSQTRNGIYAGIFFAVLMADALAHGDVKRAVVTATSYVPPRSRFAEMIKLVHQWCGAMDGEAAGRAIIERWPEEAKSFNHSITNSAIVLVGLLKGGGDFTKTLSITTVCGLDTDCTAATVGSIMGCALGTAGIPRHWTEPFRDVARTDVRGMAEVKISELAQRMHRIAVKNARFG